MNKLILLVVLLLKVPLLPKLFAANAAMDSQNVQADTNEPMFRPGLPWLDVNGRQIDCHGGGILFEDGTYYWFGEQRGATNHMSAVSVYSSQDLHSWKNEGVALARSVDTNSEIARGSVVERPKVIRNPRSGQYVMWFHLELGGQGYSAARAAVAVGETATGPYRFLTSFRPNGNMSRDMSLYLDEDGKAYQIYSSRDNYDLRICRLSDDFLSATTNDVMISSDHREAPALFKHRGTYFLITSACTGWKPNEANYYTASQIMGPWIRHSNPCHGLKAATTFDSQSTFVLSIPGKTDAFIFMADRWIQRDLKNSGHIWLPIGIEGDSLSIDWTDEWNLRWFERRAK